MKILEEITNHIDLGDLVLSLYEAYDEFGDDKHGLGVRVANLLSDFKDKVEAEFEKDADTRPVIQTFYAELDKINAAGDFYLKNQKEWL